MIIFYYGSDAYRVARAGQEIIDRYQAKYPSGLNLFRIDATSPEAASRLEDVLRNDSFFQEVKLVHITGAFAKKGIGEELSLLCAKHALVDTKEVVVCICAPEEKSSLVRTSRALFAYLEKHAQPIKEFAPLTGSQQIAWIRKECEDRGVSLSAETARLLVDRAGSDSWSLVQAAETLANYRQKGNIQPADIESLVPAFAADQSIFALVDAIAAKNKPLAIELLAREMGAGRDPYYILSMITFQFRNLLSIKDLSLRKVPSGELARMSGLAPFIVRKTEAQARKFSLDELTAVFSRLAELDIAAKQGVAHLEDELMNLILRQG